MLTSSEKKRVNSKALKYQALEWIDFSHHSLKVNF